MKRPIILCLILFSEVYSIPSFSQNSTNTTFEVKKIYATAAGLKGGTINRYALADTAEISIHGCKGCKVKGFKMTGKIKYRENSRFEADDEADIKDSVIDVGSRYYNESLSSDTTLFTYSMEQLVRNNKKGFYTFYIEIFDIKVLTPDKQEVTLDKICLYLK